MTDLRLTQRLPWLAPSAAAWLLSSAPLLAQTAGPTIKNAHFNSQEVLAQVAKVTARDQMANDWLGFSVSISGDRLAVGMPLEADTGGSVRIFERQEDGSWVEVNRVSGSDTEPFDNFGFNVSLDGDVLAVGVEDDDDGGSGAGAAYVFERQAAGDWLEVAKLLLPDAQTSDNFGSRIALSSTRLAVAASGDDDTGAQSGSVSIFERAPSGQWLPTDKLTASDGTEFIGFGTTLALDGDRLAVGLAKSTDRGDAVGAVYVFDRNPDATWSETEQIESPDGAELDRFGIGLALEADRMAIGAYSNDEAALDAGAVYIYELDAAGGWQGVQKLLASDPEMFNAFGNAVALDGDQLVVGSPDTNALDNGAGGLYFFARSANGLWFEETRSYPADNNPTSDRVGQQLAMDQGRLAVGSWRDDDGGSEAGAVFIFEPVTVAPQLSLSGTCPGEIVITVDGVTPFDQSRLYASADEGSTSLELGRCAGTTLGLNEAKLVFRTRTESGQSFEILETVSDALCGEYMQILDRRTCLVSNVVQVPAP